jgi:hypothetical protein
MPNYEADPTLPQTQVGCLEAMQAIIADCATQVAAIDAAHGRKSPRGRLNAWRC